MDNRAAEAAFILLAQSYRVPWLPAVTATPSHAQTLDLQLSKQVLVGYF